MVDSRALLSEMSDDQLLVEMSMHPTPLEEKDPLALDTIKQEYIKEEIDYKYSDDVDYSKIKMKEEVNSDNLSDSIDKYQLGLTSIINIKCERSESQDKDVEQSASEATSENHLQHFVATTAYKCNVCGCVFKNKDDNVKHLMAENYKCIQCSEKFCHKSEMQTHFRAVHGIHEKIEHFNRYRINFGTMCFYSNTSSNKPYTCSVCEKSFSRSDHLKIHEKIHTGSKPYNCNFCEKSFSDRSNFRRHEKIHSANYKFNPSKR